LLSIATNEVNEEDPMGKSLKTLVFSLFLSSAIFLWGQSGTTSLRGILTDAKGALLSGATVTLSDRQTGFARTVKSDREGNYWVASERGLLKLDGDKIVAPIPSNLVKVDTQRGMAVAPNDTPRTMRDFESELTSIPGVGDKLKARLLRNFGSLKRVSMLSRFVRMEDTAPGVVGVGVIV